MHTRNARTCHKKPILRGNNHTDAAGGRSHLAAGSKLSGDLHVPGHVELRGQVDGRIYADAILIEESGSVSGELHAADIAIKGKLEGKISGAVIKLHDSANVSGEIVYETLSIENGAEVNATCATKKPG